MARIHMCFYRIIWTGEIWITLISACLFDLNTLANNWSIRGFSKHLNDQKLDLSCAKTTDSDLRCQRAEHTEGQSNARMDRRAHSTLWNCGRKQRPAMLFSSWSAFLNRGRWQMRYSDKSVPCDQKHPWKRSTTLSVWRTPCCFENKINIVI